MRLFMINRYLCHLQKIPPLKIVMLKEGEKEECMEVCGKKKNFAVDGHNKDSAW